MSTNFYDLIAALRLDATSCLAKLFLGQNLAKLTEQFE